MFAKQPSTIEVVNDLNSELINFFRVLRARPWELVALLMWQPYSRADRRASERITGGSALAVCDYFGLPQDWAPPPPDDPLPRAQAIEKLDELERIMRERPRPGRAAEED